MYPRHLYGNSRRPHQLFSPNGFLRDIPEEIHGGISENIAMAINLRTTLNQVFMFVSRILPEDCPFIIGGGFVRDGLMGAPISDIDIWLPQNLSHINPLGIDDEEVYASNMIRMINAYLHVGGMSWTHDTHSLFEAPFAGLDANPDGTAYHDMSNHWVVGTTVNGYPIQFMRTNVEWENNPSEFMSSLCRNFDIDLCMMFLCVQRDATSVDECRSTEYIVMPSEIPEYIGDPDSDIMDTMLWNTARNTTSMARKVSRFNKMASKYRLRRATGYDDFDEIRPDGIEAVPVPLSFLMTHMERLPLPVLEGDGYVQTWSIFQTETQGAIGNPVRLDYGAITAPTMGPIGIPYPEGPLHNTPHIPT